MSAINSVRDIEMNRINRIQEEIKNEISHLKDIHYNKQAIIDDMSESKPYDKEKADKIKVEQEKLAKRINRRIVTYNKLVKKYGDNVRYCPFMSMTSETMEICMRKNCQMWVFRKWDRTSDYGFCGFINYNFIPVVK